VGEAPDKRAVSVASKRGIDIAHMRARRIEDADYENFDLILAMDWDNL
jgi:protein-tyrosine phosphatase